jgi:predicted nuclease of predicted toxin-antitoxin system
VKGILADVHMSSFVEALVHEMQTEYWADYWKQVGLALYHFEDVGLTPTSTDLEIWQCCQAEQLILITNNRNADSEDSLKIAIREHNTPASLPVMTIGNIDRFRISRKYAEKVVERLYDYLVDIDRVRGAGRLFLP